MHAYLASILKANSCPTLVVGGVSDHVHALIVLSKKPLNCQCRLRSQTQLFKVDQKASTDTAEVLLAKRLRAFSVSQSHVEQAHKYILKQEQHHRRKTFQDEFREFLKRYEVDYEEGYVWD